VLAAAGLKRLGLGDRIRSTFQPEQMLPAAGQGALAIEVRADRQDLLQGLAPLADQSTWLTVTAERAVSRAMGGSCSMPLAAHGQWQGQTLRLAAAWGDLSGRSPLVRGRRSHGHDAAGGRCAGPARGSPAPSPRRRGGARGLTWPCHGCW